MSTKSNRRDHKNLGNEMNLLGLLDVSGSALQAERIRAEVVAANMANAETTRTPQGGPYRRQHVVFASEAPEPNSFAAQFLGQPGASQGSGQGEPQVGGVRVAAVVSDPGPGLERFDPGHPDADKDGYVAYPDIDPTTEMVDLMSATRGYGLNSSAIQATKSMINSSLEILKS
jgi:flagellar basal-body rod protein FlgC